jgi:ureidoacrylate peracid hydrolase
MSTNPVDHRVQVAARPEAFAFEPARAAVILVDMQNGFVSKGGYLDRAGFDVSEARKTLQNCQRLLAATRPAGVRTIYLQMGWHEDLHDAGSADGGMYHKSVALRFMRKQRQNDRSALIRGTWDYAIVDELAPQPGDFVIPKTRLSGFFETNLDSILRGTDIKTLIFAGVATNICVEATIRDALYRDFLCLVVEDATNATGPAYVKDATLFNVETILGWVTKTDALCSALGAAGAAAQTRASA